MSTVSLDMTPLVPQEPLVVKPYEQPVLAHDKVRYVGEPIALVLAESPAIAEDAAEAILLAAIPAGFFGILFGLNYGVEFQDTDSTLTISSLVGVLTLGLAIVLTAPMSQGS
jgi:hypothetical protein